ncbi:unnamed protein product, partial [Ostreobium quekettii]
VSPEGQMCDQMSKLHESMNTCTKELTYSLLSFQWMLRDMINSGIQGTRAAVARREMESILVKASRQLVYSINTTLNIIVRRSTMDVLKSMAVLKLCKDLPHGLKQIQNSLQDLPESINGVLEKGHEQEYFFEEWEMLRYKATNVPWRSQR